MKSSIGHPKCLPLNLKSLAVFFCIVLVQAGCGSSQESATERRAPAAPVADEESRRKALQYFIDGSLHESKGEYAQAVLEYQDALRYDKDPAIYFALSKCYSQLSKHSHAIEAGREAVRLAPDNLLYRKTLADAYIMAFELDSAAVQYEEMVKRDSNKLDYWYGLARLYQSRKPLKALEVYGRILQRFGDDWDVLFQVAETYTAMGQFEKAAEALKSMVAVDPGNTELRRRLGQMYARAGNYEEAIAVYDRLLELTPRDLELQAERAAIFLFKKDYAAAAAMFDPILASDSVSLDIKLRIGEMYFGQTETDSAIIPAARRVFERIRDAHPDDWRAYWFLGGIGAILREDSLSVRNFQKVTELASWNADAWVYLSSVFFDQNNFQEVVTVLEAAIKVLPDDFRVNFFLGVAYNQLGRQVEATRVLEHARSQKPDDINAISQLALVYDALGKHEESDPLYEEGLRLEPENHILLNNYGYSLAERGLQLERALQMATKAVEAQPDNAAYLDTIGWVYFRLGRYAEAERYVRRSIEKGDASAVVYEHLGDIYYKMNDMERALEQWNIALKIDSSNEALRQKIERRSL